MKPKRLPFEEFKKIYSKVPRLCVDLVITYSGGVVLTKRDIKPYVGYWHLPGGTILFDESVEETISRVAEEETGLKVENNNLIGFIDYPVLEPIGHTITMVFSVISKSGKIRGSKQGKDINFFTKVPSKTIPKQETFLKENNILK